ncbi:site-specific integrase [Clostridium sp. YIM B02515]|uniref:Site-specific integrase n=1 Tax=Clostridium rhizosphaerae TaxID=2803861 RepID=A0ABS1TGK6_9CLOT|nr:site-specific tyrosine recombinase/integron integrase [Clostridium rhizosphaerae]MBL4937746.1 site-specific integrase [Clostridium rhizosphaerae]
MTKLREQFKRDMELKGFSPSTQQSYLSHVALFAKHYNKSPELLDTEDIKAYLHYLISERNLSKSFVNQAYSGLKFLYETTLNKQWDMKKIPRTKKEKRLPQVLSQKEVKDILESVRNLKHKAILTTIYAAGLRVSEVVNLKISDIDSTNMQIRVRQGKGSKDRLTLLSDGNLKLLRDYFKYFRPIDWLFPGQDKDKPLTTRSVEKMMDKAVHKVGIAKPATVHTLRHCFATHLLESGVDIYYIQRLLGHTNIKSTSIYLHMTNMKIRNIKSPLDML